MILAALLALWPAEDVVWMKLEQARIAAARAGKPILVIVTVDPKTGNSVCGKSSGLDKALDDPAIEKRAGGFCFVRASDRKTATDVRATRCLELIFLDPEGEEIHRGEFKDAAGLDKAMTAATEKCSPRAVEWESELPPPGEAAGKPLVLAFVDERKDSVELLKALEDRTVAPLHDRVVFVRLAWKKDVEEARRWAVTQAPALLVLDPSRSEVLERVAGRKSPRELRAALLKALGKLERK